MLFRSGGNNAPQFPKTARRDAARLPVPVHILSISVTADGRRYAVLTVFVSQAGDVCYEKATPHQPAHCLAAADFILVPRRRLQIDRLDVAA